MQAEHQNSGTHSLATRLLGQIAHCLRQGCVICIEHSPVMGPRFTPWSTWGERCCFNGDIEEVYSEIDQCRSTHTDHHIRLNIEDYSFHSRFSVMVHSPAACA